MVEVERGQRGEAGMAQALWAQGVCLLCRLCTACPGRTACIARLAYFAYIAWGVRSVALGGREKAGERSPWLWGRLCDACCTCDRVAGGFPRRCWALSV